MSGIGFLGAGTIVKEGFTIKGLTTAACLWFSAAVGMACGVNQIMIALTMTAGELILVFIGKWYEKKMNRIFPFHLKLEADYSEDMHDVFKLRLPKDALAMIGADIPLLPKSFDAVSLNVMLF